jgi:multiple sugar transport system substrate-binding protein
MSDNPTRKFTRRETILSATRFLALGVGATVLAACGGAPAPTAAPAAAPKAADTTAAKPADTSAKPAAAAAGQQTLNWFTPAAPGLEADFYTSFKDDYMKKNPNVKVEVSFEAWNDYFIKLPTMLAGGSIPDVNHLHCSIAQDYGTKGAMKDMFPFLSQDKISKDVFFPFLIKQMSDYKTHTKLWALPKDSAVYGIYYNKDIFDKAGVKYPAKDWTLQQFRDACKALTIDKAGNPAGSAKFDAGQIAQWGYAWADPLPSGDNMNQFAWAQAGQWYSDDFSKAYFDDPAHVEFIQTIADMRNKDRSMPAAGDALGQGDAWRTSLVAMKVDHHQNVFFYNAEKSKMKYDCVFTPAGAKGQFIGAGCSGWTMPAKAKNPDLSWPFIKFLTSLEKQCEIVNSKRWGSGVVECEDKLMPTDGNPPSFKEVFIDPLKGSSTVKVDAIPYPPFLSEIKQVFATEYDAVVNGGKITAAEAAKKAQPQIQALLDKAAKL